MNSATTYPAASSFRLVLTAFALLTAFLYAPPHASAHIAPTTRFTGVVQSIDYKNKTITFQPGANGSSLSLGWNWQTEFLADDKRVKSDSLKAGMRVKVKYISPVFGREYATKLEWNASMNPPPSQPAAATGSAHHGVLGAMEP